MRNIVAQRNHVLLPSLFAADRYSARRFVEFFTANIRNPRTRNSYAGVAIDFTGECEAVPET